MQLTFFVMVLYGSYFFLVQRRQFDFVSAGFVGSLVYFMPGFVGYVTNPYYPWLLPSLPIIDASYVLWSLALFGTIFAGHIYNPSREHAPPPLRSSHAVDIAIILIIIMSFGGALITGGPGVMSADKHEVLENVNRFFLMFGAASQMGMISFVIQQKFIKAIVPALGIAFLLFAGFRTDLALAMIGIATYAAARRGLFSMVRLRYVVPAVLAVLVLFTYKPLLYALRTGRVDLATQYLAGDEILSGSILRSEPFITQSILNEILSRDFSMDPSGIIYSFLAIVPFLVPATGADVSSITFNFQDQIFPNLSYGAGSNIYAHFYATLGWAGVVIFILIHNALLIGISKSIRSTHKHLKLVLLLSLGAFLAFYIHRNDVVNSLSIMNRSLLTMLVVYALSRMFGAGEVVPAPIGGGQSGPVRARVQLGSGARFR